MLTTGLRQSVDAVELFHLRKASFQVNSRWIFSVCAVHAASLYCALLEFGALSLMRPGRLTVC